MLQIQNHIFHIHTHTQSEQTYRQIHIQLLLQPIQIQKSFRPREAKPTQVILEIPIITQLLDIPSPPFLYFNTLLILF